MAVFDFGENSWLDLGHARALPGLHKQSCSLYTLNGWRMDWWPTFYFARFFSRSGCLWRRRWKINTSKIKKKTRNSLPFLAIKYVRDDDYVYIYVKALSTTPYYFELRSIKHGHTHSHRSSNRYLCQQSIICGRVYPTTQSHSHTHFAMRQ